MHPKTQGPASPVLTPRERKDLQTYGITLGFPGNLMIRALAYVEHLEARLAPTEYKPLSPETCRLVVLAEVEQISRGGLE